MRVLLINQNLILNGRCHCAQLAGCKCHIINKTCGLAFPSTSTYARAPAMPAAAGWQFVKLKVVMMHGGEMEMYSRMSPIKHSLPFKFANE